MNAIHGRLYNPRMKIAWAKHQIHNLGKLATAYCVANTNAFEVVDDAATNEKVYRVLLRHPIPPEIPLIIGDAAHNLRSSLDHVVWQLVEANGQVPGRHTCFPVYADAAKFAANSGRAIHGVSTSASATIESVQPFQTGFEWIADLTELDNFDKHRLLVVAAYRLGDVFFGMRGDVEKRMAEGKPFRFDFKVSASTFGSRVIQDGLEFLRISPEQFADPDNHVQFDVRITIVNPALPQCGVAVDYLGLLAEKVESVVESFSAELGVGAI